MTRLLLLLKEESHRLVRVTAFRALADPVPWDRKAVAEIAAPELGGLQHAPGDPLNAVAYKSANGSAASGAAF